MEKDSKGLTQFQENISLEKYCTELVKPQERIKTFTISREMMMAGKGV